MRRFTRRVGDGTHARRTVVADFAELFVSGDYRFEASGYTLSGSNASNFYNKLDATKTLAQATGANQAAAPVASERFNGKLVATFTGSTRYDSNEAASAWRSLHDGTGSTTVHVFRPTSAIALAVLSSTFRSQDFATNTGSIVGYRTSGTPGTFYRVAKSVAGGVVDSDVAASIAANSATYIITSYQESVSPEYAVWLKSRLVTSGSSLAAPAAGDPTATFKLGANGVTNDLGFVGEWAATYIFKRNLSALDLSTVRKFIAYEFGIV